MKQTIKKNEDGIFMHPFQYDALYFLENMTADDKIRGIDRTEEIMPFIEKHRARGYPIRIYWSGPPSSSKSTSALLVNWDFMRYILKKQMSTEYIKRDQIEYSWWLRKYTGYECMVTVDEYNPMSDTNLGATTEAKQIETQSRIMAQRTVIEGEKLIDAKVHVNYCTPELEGLRGQLDDSATLFFEIFDVDKPNYTTTCLLRYRFAYAGTYKIQLIGHAKFNVKELLKQKWYIEYRRRKKEKMELMDKYGIYDLRSPLEAQLILNIINKLDAPAKYVAISDNFLRIYFDSLIQNSPISTSYLQRRDLVDKVHGMLGMVKERIKELRIINKLTEKRNKLAALPEGLQAMKELDHEINDRQNAYNIYTETYLAVKTHLETVAKMGGEILQSEQQQGDKNAKSDN